MMTSAATIVPAIQSELVESLFSSHLFRDGELPNLAIAKNPADGFDPTRLADGTEALWISNPAQLGIPVGARLSPLWQNGLGLIVFRNAPLQIVGGIFVNGAIRNPWNEIGKDAFQCLGGIMLFSDDPKEIKSAEQLLADAIRKSNAMKDKFQFIDLNLEDERIPARTLLGGGKSSAAHPAGEKGRRDAVRVTASVAAPIGIYISGSDQNMTGALCTYFAECAPKNFMGAANHPIPTYGGMADPSPWTALGVYHAFKTVRRKIFNQVRIPVFFQGAGNVGIPLVNHIRKDGHPISGIIDTRLEALEGIRAMGIDAPLFLQLPDGAPEPDRKRLQDANIRVVRGLVEALQQAPETVVFSPNAGPHPITMEVAEYLASSKVRAIVGAANNVLDTVDGSIEPVANFLQEHGIYSGNDSETNQMGALSVTVQRIGMNRELLERAAQGVGARTLQAIEAFSRGIPPQLARDRAAAKRYNQMLLDGRAVGGYFQNGG